MPRVLDVALKVDSIIAESSCSLILRLAQQLHEVILGVGKPHALTAPSCCGFDHHREANLACPNTLFSILQSTEVQQTGTPFTLPTKGMVMRPSRHAPGTALHCQTGGAKLVMIEMHLMLQ